jgi:diaminopimelate epimerase
MIIGFNKYQGTGNDFIFGEATYSCGTGVTASAIASVPARQIDTTRNYAERKTIRQDTK